MANFLFLMSGGEVPSSTSDMTKAMEEWGAWFAQLGDAIVDLGSPLNPTGKIVGPGGKVNDIPADVAVNGYTVIRAGSLTEAVEMAKTCPGLKSGTRVSVYERSRAM